MKSFALAAFAGIAAATSEVESAFFSYITQFGKEYKTMEEYNMRFEVFAEKHAQIMEHNATDSKYKMGFNNMSDWTQEEYEKILTHSAAGNPNTEPFVGTTYSPIDLRETGCVAPIQNQGQCGSCWTFSSVTALETNYCLHVSSTNAIVKLSEQQLVDCVRTCYGCNGGLQQRAFFYYETHYAMSESSYPYVGVDTTCSYSSSNNTGIYDTGYTFVTADDPDAMKATLSTSGAHTSMSVSIQANQFCFQNYSSGIFDNTKCGTNLDHAVAVVGWGEEGSTQYWILRNSWGTTWGEEGYMRIEIVSGHGLCGIQMEPLYPYAAGPTN